MGTNSPWDNNNPNKYFSGAIDALFPDSYKTAFQGKDLYSSLRCCLIHRFSPKENIALSDGGQHLQEISINGVNRIVINCAQLYEDFKKACTTVINDSKYDQKTNSDFYTSNDEQGGSVTASTENYLQALQPIIILCMDMEDFVYPCIGIEICHDLPNDTRISVS